MANAAVQMLIGIVPLVFLAIAVFVRPEPQQRGASRQ
jgi:hypothetical protein